MVNGVAGGGDCPSILSEGPEGGQVLRLVFPAPKGLPKPNCLASSGPALVALPSSGPVWARAQWWKEHHFLFSKGPSTERAPVCQKGGVLSICTEVLG